MSTLAATAPSPLWYLTRGTGLVALVLLTGTVVLGVVTTSRWQRPGWPRFASLGLHRNLSLLTVLFLASHILTAELDTFAPVGWLATVVPFGSAYRPLWLGLGTLAFDLLVALVVTSLIRSRLGYRTWRTVHWLAYLSWPVALVHGLGTGTDAPVVWVQLLDVCCVIAVLAATGWRLAHSSRAELKTAGSVAVAVSVLGLSAWALTGPLKPGWAKRAGTPNNLLATSQTNSTNPAAGAPTRPVAPAVPSQAESSNDVPALPFQAVLGGRVSEAGPDGSGQVTITIDTNVSGSMTGSLVLVLRGQSTGSGVSLASSSVTFGPTGTPGEYQGEVVILNGDQLVAQVKNSVGSRADLGILLQIDPSSGSVRGTVQATRANSSLAPSSGDGDSDGTR